MATRPMNAVHPSAATVAAHPPRLCAHELAEQIGSQHVSVIDVREPIEYASGHIPGSLNVPLSQLGQAHLPAAPLVLVCLSGNRSAKGVRTLLEQGYTHPVNDLAGGLPGWQLAGLPLHRLGNAPLPLMRQVQIAAGVLVLLGLSLGTWVAPAWILLSWFVGAGLVLAGVSGF